MTRWLFTLLGEQTSGRGRREARRYPVSQHIFYQAGDVFRSFSSASLARSLAEKAVEIEPVFLRFWPCKRAVLIGLCLGHPIRDVLNGVLPKKQTQLGRVFLHVAHSVQQKL